MKIINKLVIVSLIASLALTGCGNKEKEENKEDNIEKVVEEENTPKENNDKEISKNNELNQLELPKEGEEIAIMHTNYGDIKIRLFDEVAPKAVENFKTHAKNGYYDGLTFHRVMDEFMIQGGDPVGNGTGGESIWGKPFEDEFNEDYHNFRGALAMANSGANTNGSQFFIVQNDTVDKGLIDQMKATGEKSGFSNNVISAYEELGGAPWLDFVHTVFGQVYEGMDVVDEIAKVEVDVRNDMPVDSVLIKAISIEAFK